MPYKPKFCCQCGEKIERIDWKPWNSRRFCELCETEFGIFDWIVRGFVGIGLVFGLFGIGIYLQKPDKQLNVAQNQYIAQNTKSDAVPPKTVAQVSNISNVPSQAQASNSAQQTKPPQPAGLKTRQAELLIIAATEKTYFCGATTKKGTMCSRRVKGGGRCWQHEGQTAMLPQEKLLFAQ